MATVTMVRLSNKLKGEYRTECQSLRDMAEAAKNTLLFDLTEYVGCVMPFAGTFSCDEKHLYNFLKGFSITGDYCQIILLMVATKELFRVINVEHNMVGICSICDNTVYDDEDWEFSDSGSYRVFHTACND